MKFKKPKEYQNEKKQLVQTRIKMSKKETLENAAASAKISLAELMTKLLEDYADWLDKPKNGT